MIARRFIVLALACAVFALGMGTARAAFGWIQYSTPCAPTGVSVSANEIAIICPDDSHVYIKQR